MGARLLVVLALLTSACTTADTLSTSPSPSTPWTPPAAAVPAPLPRAEVPAITSPLTLERAIDIALSNNPDTRTAWLEARQAQALLGAARSAYFPEVGVGAAVTRDRDGTSFGPSLDLTYLLFDFGGREAQVEQSRQTLVAAGFTHNQVLQDVVLQTEQAYYGVLDAKALLEAQAATLKERQASLDAADARHKAGVATIADVLEARTALSQTRLNYETIEGQLQLQRGLLATTMGVPVTTPIELGALPVDVPVEEVSQKVEMLIEQAQRARPELAASRALVERARARVRDVRSQFMPSFGVKANTARRYSTGTNASPYSVGVAMRFPLFTGFRNIYDVRAAELGARIAGEDARAAQQQVELEVWSSYFSLSTAVQRVRTSRDLLRSARESVDVALGRYRGGVGTIIELLTAQAALEVARAQEVQARTDWFLAVAQLAHDTGTLGPQAGEATR